MKTSELQELLNKQLGFTPKAELMCKVLGLGARQSWYQRVARDSEVNDDEIKNIEHHFAISLRENNNTNCVDIDYFENVYGSCGIGAKIFDETSQRLTVPKNMIENYSKGHRYSVINSKGDSMTPFIQDNDKLIVEHWEGSQIIDNRIYVFSYDNEIFVKRLVKNVTQIIIKSDNPIYEPIKIEGKDKKFSLIGQIVGLLRDVR